MIKKRRTPSRGRQKEEGAEWGIRQKG